MAPTTSWDFRGFIRRNTAVFVDTGSAEKAPLNDDLGKYDRVPYSSDSPIDSDEGTVITPSEKDLDDTEAQPKATIVKALKQHHTTRLWLIFSSLIAGILLVLTALFTLLSGWSKTSAAGEAATQSTNYTPLGLNCGSSLAEAKANNCTFDLLSYSWTPFPCYEAETDLEFREWVQSPTRQFGPFPFFIDQAGKVRISDIEAMSFRAAPGSLAHTTQEEHLGHCVFWMRRIERVLHGNGHFTERGMMEDGVPHSVHCTKSLLDRLENGINPVDKEGLHGVIGIGFNTC